MKKMLVAAFVLATGTAAFAQQQVKFGPKAGVNFSNLSKGSDFSEAKMRTGFHVGAVAEIKFNEKFSIQPEVVYSTQGSEVTNLLIGNSSAVSTIKNDYINVPIMAKYYIVDGFSVEAGPQVGFLMKSETEGTIVTPIGTSTGTVDSKDTYNSVDFGVNFGLAYDLPAGLFVNARYNLGLSDVIKDNTRDAIKNTVIQVGLGYKFD